MKNKLAACLVSAIFVAQAGAVGIWPADVNVGNIGRGNTASTVIHVQNDTNDMLRVGISVARTSQ